MKQTAICVFFVLSFLSPGTVFAQISNGVLREVYLNVNGGTIRDLTNNPSFPSNPSLGTLEPLFEAPSSFGDYYGQRMRALLTAPVTGNYIFWIASDDQGFLYLSTDGTPATRRLICAEPQWGGSRDWDGSIDRRTNATALFPAMNPNLPANRSDYAYGTITLTAGQRYYIEALQIEGAGGDNLAVGWQLPGGTQERPIPGNRVVPYGLGPPVITRQPTNLTVIEGGAATFSVTLSQMLGATFQWLRNGTNVPGATNNVYGFGPVSLSDSSNRFRCFIANAYGTTNSAEAVLAVLPDTTRPTISTVGNLGEPQIVFVVFSEPVEAGTATTATNYTINGGVTVTRAVFGVDTRTLILTVTPLAPNVTYTLTVNNVRDRATTPNTILANTQRTFSLTVRPLDVALLSLSREPLAASSRRHGVVISEVMYHPTNRTDGRNLEFIEVYNSQPWFEELGGWRISGAVDYVFPPNTVLQGRSFLVVAAIPADFRAAYNFTNVFGPFNNSNGLQNSSGTLRLRNSRDAVVFEMDYSGDPPYPVAADGAGHSLVLARPSYGERDPRAWAASDVVGGSPGVADAPGSNPFRTILINEFLAHTDLPDVDFIELYNYGAASVNIGGCILTDDPTTNRFIIPTNTLLPARGFVVFTQIQLGFALSAGGESLFLKNPNGTRVLDALRFGAQENGVATGRYPDGAPDFSRLATATPGTNNALFKSTDVVINEIMFDPISADSNDEYLELYNRGGSTLNLGGWRIRDAVSFNIPAGTAIPAGGYLVIAKNAARLRTNYFNLTTANCLGDYSGTLGNSGERIELKMPDEVVSTNALGQPTTNIIHIMVDEVTYGPGGRWGKWAGGGGSSLELRDARADRRLAPNWGDSDEAAKSQWVTVEATGVMDNGWADAYQLHITLMGPGECLVDNVEVVPAGGTNVIGNAAFENDASGWVFQGNHNQTSWEPSEGYGSSRSLHLRATGRGDTGANRVRTQLPYTLSPGTTVTLRAKVRWLKGNPNILLRLRGNWQEAPGYSLTARNLGTPGAANSRSAPNVGPAISEVRHFPALPPANQPVLVLARVNDPDGLAYLAVSYRVEPGTNYLTLAMTNNGAGFYSTVIPGQAGGVSATFFIQATDNFTPAAGSAFPDDAPARECIVRWGDNTIPGTMGTYRFWISQANVNRWAAEEKMSNNPKDITFIYGTNRIIYNAGGMFHGSPYHSPGYNSPVGASCDYDLVFPVDDRLLGETDINLFRPGNGGGDSTAQAEIHGYWFGWQFGAPFLYHRPVFVFVNGQRRDAMFYDAQQPNGDFVNQWFPDDADGDLHKIQIGFEFGDQAYGASEPGYAVVGADLSRYLTTGGVFKQARYRQTWPLRSASPSQQNDYTNLFALVNAAQTSAPIGSDAYTSTLAAITDVEEWFKIHVTQHLYNNYDSFSYGGGQNAFAYKPERDPWKLLLWDIDFAFGGSATDANLFSIGGAEHGPRNTHPPFARIYWQMLIEAANGMMTVARSNPILDSRYSGMTAGGASVGSPQGIKDFIATRRSLILSVIASNQSPFAITSNGGADFTTNRNLITLSGSAPLDVRTILVNGAAYPVTWTSLSNWIIRVPLTSGTNALQITGIDPKGAPVSGVSGTIRVNYTGADELPQDRIVINEIMYHPAFAAASYVEIYNTSGSNAFDLSEWRLDGVGFTFPNGTIIEPGAYLVLAKDRSVFASIYGAAIPVAGEFPGNLDNGGETLTLIKPGLTSADDLIIDQVTYNDDPPWPAEADGGSSSLQLIDPLQDNNRVANWAAVSLTSTNPPQTLILITNLWKYNTNSDLTSANWTAPAYNDSAWPSGRSLLYNEGAALPAPKNTLLTLGRLAYYFRTHFTLNSSPAGAALKMFTVLDDGAVFYLNGQELYRLGMAGGPVAYSTLASRGVGDAVYEGPFIIPGTALIQGDNVLAVEAHQTSPTSSDIVFGMTLETTYDVVTRFTPGAANSARATLPPFPTLWLNEVLPNNFFPGTNGLTDRFDERDPWVELYNGSTNTLSLAGSYLANNYTNLAQWAFPSNAVIGPRQFLVVWLDDQPAQSSNNEFHANFRARPDLGAIVLSKGTNLSAIIDFLNYNVPVPGRSYGSFPDGAISGRRVFGIVTPGATNNPAFPPIDVRINEWMADNSGTLPDPTDGRYEDWFELYNPAPNAVDLSGYFLGTTLTNTTQSPIPSGATIPAGGYLLVWADGALGQNSATNADIHANFSLSKNGESIALFAPDGTLIDAVSFGQQAADVSQGRFPDGNTSIYAMTNPTPRAANYLFNPNTPPILEMTGDKTVNEGSLLSFTVVATDTNLPAQTLTFLLDPGAPVGARINSTNGLFTWTPTEAQGPGAYPITLRVTDSGTPSLGATQAIIIIVNEVNNAPVLAAILSRNVSEGTTLMVTNSATDPDNPPQTLTFSLDPGSPAGATIDPATGLFTWTPTEDQGPGNYSITIRVADDGEPPLSDTRTLAVFVSEVNGPPQLAFASNCTVYADSLLRFTALASDTDLPAQSMTFGLDPSAPSGARIDAATGDFTWTPTSDDVGTNVMTLRVADDGSPPGVAAGVLTVVVLPVLRAGIGQSSNVVSISFATIPGRTYRVEYKNNLAESSWTQLGTNTVAAAAGLTFEDDLDANTQRFYRITSP